MKKFEATIYHNPRCGSSRNTLELMRHAGVNPVVVDYLANPPTREQLIDLIRRANLTVRAALRAKEPRCAELKLADPGVSDDALLDAMLREPILINRPFVETPLGVRLCRPSELVLEILPTFEGDLVKEDGEVVR